MRLGRPRLDPDDTTVTICVRFSPDRYDVLFAEAQRERVSVPELLRRALAERTHLNVFTGTREGARGRVK